MTSEEKRVYTGSVWEEQVAYCRALRVNDQVFVAGTTAVDAQGDVVGPGDMHAQATFILAKIGQALAECGASLRDVVRTRMFVTDMGMFEALAGAHRAAFTGIDPVATCVEVRALVRPELVVEIEVDAVIRP